MKLFYDTIRAELFKGSISTAQFEGIEAILKGAVVFKVTRLEQIAYILATAYHETAKTMQPIQEFGKGKNYRYGSKIKRDGKPYNLPDEVYYGRGLVQLTWYENYLTMGAVLGLPLLQQPELLLKMEVSIKVMFYGMLNGTFTGAKLSTYINEKRCDFYNARRIINGIDAAKTIAAYAEIFLKGLKLAQNESIPKDQN